MTHPAHVRHGANGSGLNGYGRAKTSDQTPSNLASATNGSGLRVHLDTTEEKPRPMSFYDK